MKAPLVPFAQRTAPLDPHALAQSIVGGMRYRIASQPKVPSLWERFWQWVAQMLDRLFAHVPGPSQGVADALSLLLLLAGVALVVFVLVRLLRNVSAAHEEKYPHARALHTRATAKRWYELALDAAQSGRYREAAVLLFRAALTILDLRGFVHDDPSHTVDECANELRERAPQYLTGFTAVARLFSAALYADAPVAAQDFERARSAYEALFASVTGA